MQAEKYLFNNGPYFSNNHEKEKSNIKQSSQKFTQVQSMMLLIKTMNIPEMGAFLLGYLIGDLKININDKDTKKLVIKIGESLDLVREGIIRQQSLIQVIVQTMDVVKKQNNNNNNSSSLQLNKQNSNNNNSPKRIAEKKNRMQSQQQRLQDIQLAIKLSQQQQYKYNNNNNPYQLHNNSNNLKETTTTSLFITTFQSLLSELALDPHYLHTLWHQQQYYQQQQLQSKQMIDKMMAQDSQKRQLQQNKKLQCQICLMDIQFTDMAPLSKCKHIFHITCLHQHIKASIDNSIIQIKCPMQECKNYLQVNDIQAYVDADLMDKYYKFSLNKYVESGNNMTSWCPTAGCSAVFEYDEALDNYRCPVCRKHYCLMCRTDYHYGMSCAEYRISRTFSEEDRKFEDFVRGAKFKQCPKCKFWVERVAGCSSMACRCGIQFCYDCGGTACPHGRCTGSGRVPKK